MKRQVNPRPRTKNQRSTIYLFEGRDERVDRQVFVDLVVHQVLHIGYLVTSNCRQHRVENKAIISGRSAITQGATNPDRTLVTEEPTAGARDIPSHRCNVKPHYRTMNGTSILVFPLSSKRSFPGTPRPKISPIAGSNSNNTSHRKQ